jgi:hypothetical protein
MTATRRFAIAIATGLTLAAPMTARAGTAGAIFDLLRPGSRTAVGLGGDPFRSPALDQCGWWAEPGFSRDPLARISAYSGQPFAPRSVPGRGELITGESSWQGLGASRIGSRELLFAGRLIEPRWRGSFGESDGALRFSSAGSRADGALRVESLARGLSVQVAGPLWHDAGAPEGGGAGAGLRWRASPSLLAQASWSRSRVPGNASVNVRDIPVATTLNLRSEQARFDVRVAAPGRIALEGGLSRSRYAPLAPRSAALEYQVEPGGTGHGAQLTLEGPLARTVTALARVTRAGFDAGADLSWGGERFGDVNVAQLEARSLLLGVEVARAGGTRLLFDAEHVAARGRAHGTVEFWPFTPIEADLLALRGTALVRGNATLNRLHAGIERAMGRASRARAGLGWYDMKTHASIETWRPLFLVFGRADDRLDHLDTHRVQLGAVSLGLERRIAGIDAGLGLEQFVFAKSFKTHINWGTGPPSPNGEPAPPRAKGWPGGTQIELSLSRGF